MNSLFLGFLYLYITINQIETLDNLIPASNWDNVTESVKFSVGLNCTQCNITPEMLCSCIKNYGKYLICCPDSQCCYCDDCAPYLRERRQELLMITQISVTILCAFGIIGLLVIYCKLCRRPRQDIRRPRCIVFRDEYDTMTHCSTIEDLRERPPPYSEIVHNASVHASSNNAPPLYTSPYNRISMQEAPPSYPGTPKPQERPRDSDQPPIVPITQHM